MVVKGIQVNQQFSNHLSQVEVMEDQIKQVILSFIQNSADSISGEGQITLTTEQQGSQLKIKIQDTGHGISEDDRIHIPKELTKCSWYKFPIFIDKVENLRKAGINISGGISPVSLLFLKFIFKINITL